MDAHQARAIMLSFPHVVETMQWSDNLVFWTGNKAIGGKMFSLVDLAGGGKAVISFAAGPERYAELVETDGMIPAPYMARIWWVAVERWSVFRARDREAELRAAYDLTFAKLSARTRNILDLPLKEQHRLIAERRPLHKERGLAKDARQPT